MNGVDNDSYQLGWNRGKNIFVPSYFKIARDFCMP